MVGDGCLFGNIFLSCSLAIRGLVVCIPRSVINKVKRRWVDVLQHVYILANFAAYLLEPQKCLLFSQFCSAILLQFLNEYLVPSQKNPVKRLGYNQVGIKVQRVIIFYFTAGLQ